QPEVADGLERQPADTAKVVAVARDADHESAEDDRHDHRLDHAQEGGRERLERRSRLGREPAEEGPPRHPPEGPPGRRQPPQRAEHHRPTSAPALASMPASSEAYDAANLATPSVSSSRVMAGRSIPCALRACRSTGASLMPSRIRTAGRPWSR